MAKKPAQSDPAYEAAKARYAALVATIPEAGLKGATMPYTSLNGNMFSYLHPSGRLALRLGKEDRERFLADHATTLFEAYGVVQKEYVTVPATLLGDTARLVPHFRASFDYAATLKPKPTKRRRRAKRDLLSLATALLTMNVIPESAALVRDLLGTIVENRSG